MRDTLLFSKKKTQVAPRSSCYRQSPTFVRTKSRRACAEAALRAAATLYDRAKLRSSGRIVVSVLASRDRFEVLGVGGDINKSTTFGTEDKYNPFRSRNLSCATIPNPAEPHGNRNRGGDRDLGMLRAGARARRASGPGARPGGVASHGGVRYGNGLFPTHKSPNFILASLS